MTAGWIRTFRRIAVIAQFAASVIVSSPVLGRPQIVLGDDPRAAEIRAAATEFWHAIAEGDSTRANSLLTGTPQQAELIDAYIRLAAELETMIPLLREREERFPQLKELKLAPLRDRLKLQPSGAMVLTEEKAWIVGQGRFFNGTQLERIEGQWRVTRLSPSSAHASLLRDEIEIISDFSERLRPAVINDDKALADVAAEKHVADQLARRLEIPEDTAPECEAAPAPMTEPLRSAAELQEMLGAAFGSDEVRGVMESLPGLPRIGVTGNSLFIKSDEIGVELGFFGGPDYALKGIQLPLVQREGSHPYLGELPFGLSREDRRQDVERKLGPPPASHGGGSTRYWAQYPHLGLIIVYAGFDPTDRANRISAISLREPQGEAPPASDLRTARLAFRLVEEHPLTGNADVEMLADPEPTQNPGHIAVRREVLIDELSVASVNINVDPSTAARIVTLQMSSEGAKRLHEVTSQNVGRRIAVVLDGQVLLAPTIRSAISRDVAISFEPDAAKDEAGTIAGRIHGPFTPSCRQRTQQAVREKWSRRRIPSDKRSRWMPRPPLMMTLRQRRGARSSRTRPRWRARRRLS